MKTFATLFTGGGGADIGAMQAGYNPIWGIEYIPEIAAVCRENLGHEVICASVLDVDPAELVSPDWLHMSPPCPNFSVAKTNRGETENDLALGRKMREFIRALQPKTVSIENVYEYRKSLSFAGLWYELQELGYKVEGWHLNSADYGVPQTRRRFIVVGRRGNRPVKPFPTHQRRPDMFSRRWVSWHEVIEDLIPELPESQFAPWQLDRLPESYKSLLMSSTEQRIPKPYVEDAPVFTVTTGWSLPRAFIADGQPSSNGEKMTVRDGAQPIQTVTATQNKKMHTAFIGRVVAMTPRCLARFQSFPDWYELPEKKALACRIIGNAVPPLLMQRVIEAQ